MSLPQLVGKICAICNRSIGSILEGVFCESCGNPVHVGCRQVDTMGQRDGKCAQCGSDPGKAASSEVRQELGISEPLPSVANTRPVSDHSLQTHWPFC